MSKHMNIDFMSRLQLIFSFFLLICATGWAQSTAPRVETHPFVARGSTAALLRSTVTGNGVKEQGICWSTDKNPTIENERTTDFYERRGRLFHLQGLTPATVYYMRAYAIGSDGAVGYGDVVKVITLPKGNTTYTYNANDATSDQSRRIKAALEETVKLYNDWQGIIGLSITCNYSSGTPTADCSYGGWMRMGPNASYQRTGTVLHETNHAVGVGTSSRWKDNPNLRENTSRGLWLGERANQMVKFLENDESVNLTGDVTHMWPTGGSPLAYGINGAHEDTGNQLQYIGNVLITHALGEDGLTLTNYYDNGYPYYSIDVDDSVKYYIKNVDESLGLYTSYVAVGPSGLVRLSTTPNDSAAWYVSFNTKEGKYIFKNVATGRYLTHAVQNFRDVIRANVVASLSDEQQFQIMPTRKDVTVGESWNCFTARPVYFCFPYYADMTAEGKNVTATVFDHADNMTTQHWFVLSESEKNRFQTMMAAFTVDTLFIGGHSFDQFNNERYTYHIGMNSQSTVEDCQLKTVLSSRFKGSATITQPDTFPGSATLTLTDKDGTVIANYDFHFYTNLVYQWNAGTEVGATSKANKWGWNCTNNSSIIWGSANGINTHFMDPGKGSSAKYEGYTFCGRPYNNNRMLMLYFSSSEDVYSYTFQGLKPSTTYLMNMGVGWHMTEVEGNPKLTVNIGVDETLTSAQVILPAEAHDLCLLEQYFTTPDTIDTETLFFISFSTTDKSRLIVADLSVMESANMQLREDVNRDGMVDTQDALMIYNQMKSSAILSEYDVNNDGVTDTQDVLKIYEYIQNH